MRDNSLNESVNKTVLWFSCSLINDSTEPSKANLEFEVAPCWFMNGDVCHGVSKTNEKQVFSILIRRVNNIFSLVKRYRSRLLLANEFWISIIHSLGFFLLLFFLKSVFFKCKTLNKIHGVGCFYFNENCFQQERPIWSRPW